ncbi:hypothetical protein AOXY_G15826 [Acipenser oxyrinchus oxyrinchus]|uniref:Uncharacterized protein n=1 Tax=Acipenser oxyrinchus oxyrinchus TaxID=40147 RepID=A0AAD8G5P0_ACIOX|nr:hypothetical protein AOXY_G15826 [Acipenser oxyrinchus oxyrinchus]
MAAVELSCVFSVRVMLVLVAGSLLLQRAACAPALSEDCLEVEGCSEDVQAALGESFSQQNTEGSTNPFTILEDEPNLLPLNYRK